MEFKLGDIVNFRGYKAQIIGFKPKSMPIVIHRFEEKQGWDGASSFNGIFTDKTFEVTTNISSYNHCFYVFENEINFLERQNKIIEEIIPIKEDLSSEKLILKKLIKLQSNSMKNENRK